MNTAKQRPSQGPSEAQIDTTRAQQPDDPSAAAKLPHERDQSLGATSDVIHPEMKQAHDDLKNGLKDTDARGKDGRPLGAKPPNA